MKKILFSALGLFLFSTVYALSFAPGTVFLKAYHKADCEANGGEFTEWAGEVYCTVAASGFADLDLEHENHDAVSYVKHQSIVKGYDDGTFKPERAINRAELTKIVIAANFSTQEISQCSPNQYGFDDVPVNAWFAPYICMAKKNGVINGYPDGTFRPAQNVNFVEASKIITKSFGYKIAEGGDLWYQNYVTHLGQNNTIPVSIQTFDKSITRGEMAEIIYRIKANITEKSSRTFVNGKLMIKANKPQTKVPETNPGDIHLASSDCKVWADGCAKCERIEVDSPFICPSLTQCQTKDTGCLEFFEIAPPSTATPPENCKVWYDGCNTCNRGEAGGSMACTKRACFQQQLPECREFFDTPTPPLTPPDNCKIWYDGCNTCSRGEAGGLMACTQKACFQQQLPECREFFGAELPLENVAGSSLVLQEIAEYVPLTAEALNAAFGNQKVALFFHADWCPKCIAHNKEIENRLNEIVGNSIIFKVDYDTESELKTKFGVTTQDTLVVLDTNKKVSFQKTGFSVDELILTLAP